MARASEHAPICGLRKEPGLSGGHIPTHTHPAGSRPGIPHSATVKTLKPQGYRTRFTPELVLNGSPLRYGELHHCHASPSRKSAPAAPPTGFRSCTSSKGPGRHRGQRHSTDSWDGFCGWLGQYTAV